MRECGAPDHPDSIGAGKLALNPVCRRLAALQGSIARVIFSFDDLQGYVQCVFFIAHVLFSLWNCGSDGPSQNFSTSRKLGKLQLQRFVVILRHGPRSTTSPERTRLER